MSYENWLNYLRSAEKSSVMSGQHRRVFYKFPNGQKMTEEYNMETGIVEKRGWLRTKQLMSEPEWDFEVGEFPRPLSSNRDINGSKETDLLVKESATAPSLSKRITRNNIEWRVRNLPYDISVYKVRADPETRKIIISTTNKKYYKVLTVHELDRCNLPPVQDNISVHHQYNTLIISYRKPDIVKEMEAQVLMLLKDVPTNESNISDMLKQLVGGQT